MGNMKKIILLCLISLALLQLGGCAVNPVSGDSDFVLMSEDEEISIGRQYHPQILMEYGRYDDPGLQSYVQHVGEGLGAKSHRANLIYRFTVLDSQEVNAFALPGGYIYITRGLLSYLNSEAELAAVLGHEIGHVTARHAVRQQSASAATGILASVIAATTGVNGAGDLLNTLGTALVRGYGREHELESDRLGAEYLARTGYDANAMIDVIRVLKDQENFEQQLAREEGREPRVYHGVFSTHPDNDTRLKEVVGRASKLKQAGAGSIIRRDRFLKELDGLAFGDGEKEGVRRGNAFYHQELGVTLEFPAGWKIDNQPSQLVSTAPQGKATLAVRTMDLNRKYSPQQFLEKRLKLENLRNGESIHQGAMNGYTAISKSRSPYGTRLVRYVVLFLHYKAWVFAGAARDESDPYKYDTLILNSARSFRELTAAERKLARSQRIHIITARPGATYNALAKKSVISNYAERQLRLLNNHYPEGEPVEGQQLKIIE
jgi:predicted Zn-dependent protease